MVDRRRFLLGAAAVGAGAAGAAALAHFVPGESPAQASDDHPGVLAPGGKATLFRKLGRTGLNVAAVGVGAGSISDPALLARAADKGINYVDTAVCYGDSEEVIGRAFQQNPGLRKKLLLATKWDAGATMPKDRILASLDRSLKRLGTDVIDVMQIHWLGGGHLKDDTGFNRLDNAALYEAMQDAKKAGKVRFFGATSHDGNRSKILQYAIDKGVFDVLLIKMNLLDYDKADIPALLQKAKAKDIGVVVMKSQPEGGHVPPGFEKSKLSIYQANLRWVLDHDVACVVHSGIGTDAHVQDLAIGAAQSKLTEGDREMLDEYATALSPEYCRGCGATCEAACPEGVSIGHVLHFRMYDRRMGQNAYARELYRELPEKARWSETCLDCTRCLDACPHGVDAPGRLLDARKRLG